MTIAEKVPTMLNPFQQICTAAYGEGDFAHIESVDQAHDVGDPLFAFLMAELASSEGCDCREEALRRLEMAAADIHRVIDAFDQMIVI
jgi:hypothetical protein